VFDIVSSEVCSATVLRAQCCFHSNDFSICYSVDSDIYVINTNGTNCCVAIKTVVTVLWYTYIACLVYLLFQNVESKVARLDSKKGKRRIESQYSRASIIRTSSVPISSDNRRCTLWGIQQEPEYVTWRQTAGMMLQWWNGKDLEWIGHGLFYGDSWQWGGWRDLPTQMCQASLRA
jgi:hypothetical protein